MELNSPHLGLHRIAALAYPPSPIQQSFRAGGNDT